MTQLNDAAERLIVGRMILGLHRAIARRVYPALGANRSSGMILIAVSILVADIQNNPPTASTLARQLRMPRATALRKLAELAKIGIIFKRGDLYCVNRDYANAPECGVLIREEMRLIKHAAKELSKLNG